LRPTLSYIPGLSVRGPELADRTGIQLFVAAVCIAFILVVYSLIEPLTTDRGWSQLILTECLLVMVITLGPVALRSVEGQGLDLFEPMVVFGFIYSMMFAARPAFLLSPWARHIDEIPTEVHRFLSLSPPAIALALFYALIGVAAFHTGYRSFKPRPLPLRPFRPSWSAVRTAYVAVAGMIFAATSAVLIAPAIAGAGGVLSNFGRLRGALVGYGYQSLGLDLLPVLALILYVAYLRGKREPFLIACLLFVLVVSNSYNSLLGSRAGVFNLWLFLFLAHHYLSTKSGDRKIHAGHWLAVFLIVAIIVFFAVSAAELRNQSMTTWNDIPSAMETLWLGTPVGVITASAMLEFDQVDLFATILNVGPQTFPFLWGKSYLELLYQPVPRALWPAKPWPFDLYIGWYATGGQTALPPGIVGELYLNFHVAGIVVGMYLLGVICRVLYARLACSGEPAKVLIYSLVLPFLPVFLLRSFVPAATTTLALTLPAIAAVSYITSPRGRLR